MDSETSLAEPLLVAPISRLRSRSKARSAHFSPWCARTRSRRVRIFSVVCGMFRATKARSPSLQSAITSEAVGLTVSTVSTAERKNLSRFQMAPSMTGMRSRRRFGLTAARALARSAETLARLASVAAERVSAVELSASASRRASLRSKFGADSYWAKRSSPRSTGASSRM